MKLRDRAVLLVSYPASHTSCVLHLLTREHGVVHLFARGFRRITGKLGFQGSGDSLTLGEVIFRPQSTELALDALGQMLAQDWAEELRPDDGGDLMQLARRCLVAEAIDSLFGAGQVETELFDLVVEYLEYSQPAAAPTATPPARPDRLLAQVLIRLLTLAGHRPDLQRSVVSGQPMPAGRWQALYSFERGGTITLEERNDPALFGPFWELPSGIARVTDRFALHGLKECATLNFPASADGTLLDFAIVLVEAAAERTLKSARPLRRRRSPFGARRAQFAG